MTAPDMSRASHFTDVATCLDCDWEHYSHGDLDRVNRDYTVRNIGYHIRTNPWHRVKRHRIIHQTITHKENSMGMFDNDVNFEDHFEVGDRFVLTGMRYEGKITTRFGEAERTTMEIVTRDSYPKREKFSALGVGFANMAKRAERNDFPVVVEYIVVDLPNNKTLKRLALVDVKPGPWKDGDDGPPINIADYTPASGGATGDVSSATDTDIPF